MEFAALDFETANESPSSACQLGVVVVRQGEIVARHSWLIRPQPMYFRRRNIEVHGITPGEVADAADFSELWNSIAPLVHEHVFVAHNARFDVGVLTACLRHFGLAIPHLEFSCTRAVARAAWPGQPGYGLKAVAGRLGIDFRHHDALEDAEACACILLEAARHCGAATLTELEQQLQLSRGRAGHWGIGGPRQLRSDPLRGSGSRSRGRLPADRAGPSSTFSMRSSRGRVMQGRFRFQRVDAAGAILTESDWVGLRKVAAEHCGLQDQCVVFTGVLTQLDRSQAETLVELAGGRAEGSVTRRTTLLVVGQRDDRTRAAGRSISGKQERAEQLRCGGQSIDIVSEHDFLRRLRGPEAASDRVAAPRARSASAGHVRPMRQVDSSLIQQEQANDPAMDPPDDRVRRSGADGR